MIEELTTYVVRQYSGNSTSLMSIPCDQDKVMEITNMSTPRTVLGMTETARMCP